MEPTSEDTIRAGRYSGDLAVEQDGGEGVRLDVQLRLDPGGRIELSADLFRRPAPDDDSDPYVASVRATGPAVEGPSWLVTWTDDKGHEAPGTAEINSGSASSTVGLRLDQPLGGLAAGSYSGDVTWRGSELRTIDVETEVEIGTRAVAAVRHRYRDLDVVACFVDAGFAATSVGDPTPIQRDGTWHEADIFTELNGLMAGAASSRLDRASWVLHLLLLGRSTREGLFGLMFDHVGDLQRQGAAVFVEEIRDWASDPDDAHRRILQTSLHELGHALNLLHRFSDQVRLVDSTSFMNYDWRYKGGCRSGDYWRDFAFTFDPDELDFLRHGPYPLVVPGGHAFASARYWPEPAARAPVPELQLWLTPPRSGTTFIQGQPMYLEVSLRNTGSRPAYVQSHALDVKAGYLDLLVQPEQGGAADSSARVFVPFTHRCFDVAATPDIPVMPGESLHANISLAYGMGSTFAEPGAYRIRPVLTCAPFPDGDGDVTVLGDPLRIDVVPAPQDMQADLDFLLGRPVGAWMALGGAEGLDRVGDQLDELRATWLRDGIAGPTHPTIAAINRTAGIYAARGGNPETAALRLAESCTPSAVASFDPHTAEQTRRLWQSSAAEVEQQYSRSVPTPAAPGGSESTVPAGVPPAVVVALTPTNEAGPGVTRYVPGVPLTPVGDGDDADRSWVVIAPVDAELAAAESIEAVVITSREGLGERVAVTDVDLVRPDSTSRAFAVVTLARSITAFPTGPIDRQAVLDALEQGSDLWGALSSAGAVPETVTETGGQLLGEWVDASVSALASAPPPPDGFAPVAASVTAHSASTLDELANWVCRLTPLCSEPGADTAPWERARTDGSTLRRCPQ